MSTTLDIGGSSAVTLTVLVKLNEMLVNKGILTEAEAISVYQGGLDAIVGEPLKTQARAALKVAMPGLDLT